MKKMFLSLVLGALGSLSLAAAPLNLTFTGFSNSLPNAVTGIAGGGTSVTFGSASFSNLSCTGSDASQCGAGFNTGTATVNFTTGALLSNNAVETFVMGNVTYTLDQGWTVQNLGGNFYGIHTTGTYSASGFTNTAGTLDFSFQNVQGGASNFSASGSTVPEPASMALMGLGLAGLGLVARRRRASK